MRVPYAPARLVRQHNEVNQAHDVPERKTFNYGDEQRGRQVEEVELWQRGDTTGRPHSELSV